MMKNKMTTIALVVLLVGAVGVLNAKEDGHQHDVNEKHAKVSHSEDKHDPKEDKASKKHKHDEKHADHKDEKHANHSDEDEHDVH